MATAHNVKDMGPQDGKFQFRLRDRPGGAARVVWGYILPPYPCVKIDGEHTYLWTRDPRIEQIVLAFAAGGSYRERVAAHEDTLFGCHARSDGEVCLWSNCPLTGGKPGFIPSDRPCPLDKIGPQESLELGQEPA